MYTRTRQTKSILIVDDNEDALDLMSDTLSQHGFRVMQARSGPEAIAKAGRITPDLVVLDIMMPDMNGFDVLDYIRSNDELSEVPVIMQTAYPSEEHGRRVVEESHLNYMLCKPLRLDVFIHAVRRSLRRKTVARLKSERVACNSS